jgi:hypothetical protein
MKRITYGILLSLLPLLSRANSPVSESSLQLSDTQKRNHFIGVQYKKIDMADAAMYRGSASSDAHITYATSATSDINLNGIEFSYGYMWRLDSAWKLETTLNFLTSLDEPDLTTLEQQYYSFEFYAQYMNVNVGQRVGYLIPFSGSSLFLYGGVGVGYSVLKITENWKEQEGNSGDSTDLKSYARHLTWHYELGGRYRFSSTWALSIAARYDRFKVDKLHTNFYGYASGKKITGESDTDVDDSRGDFSSLSYGISLAYFF